MTTDETVSVIGCVGLIPAMVLSFILRGWAIVTLWGWFLTPVFHIQPPSGAIAIGLGMVGGMLAGTADVDVTTGSSDKGRSAASIIGRAYGKLLLRAPMVVGMGWIVRHWV